MQVGNCKFRFSDSIGNRNTANAGIHTKTVHTFTGNEIYL